MAISAFPIKATTNGTRTADQPWFLERFEGRFIQDVSTIEVDFEADDETLDFANVGNATPIIIVSDDVNKTYDEENITEGDGQANFIKTDAVFVRNARGFLYFVNNVIFIPWDSDTPKDFLREIHVQFDVVPTGADPQIEFTFDGGVTWMLVNNGDTLNGVATFTYFVEDDTLFNIRATTALTNMSCIVAAD